MQAHAVHLDHDAVDLIGQRIALPFPFADEGQHIVQIAGHAVLRVYLQTYGLQRLEQPRVLGKECAAVYQQKISVEIQPPLRRDAGIKIAHGARARIARIGKLRQPLPLALFIHALERLGRHNDFAARFKTRRQPGFFQCRRGNGKRQRRNGFNVRRHLFPYAAVAARDSLQQLGFATLARPITDRHRKAIHLQFANVINLVGAAKLVHAPLPGAQLVFVVGVIEREHRRAVPHLDEAFARGAAYPLSRRIRRDQLGIFRLQLLQSVHQHVKVGVADGRLVEHVIEIFVASNLLAQRFHLALNRTWGCGLHRVNYIGELALCRAPKDKQRITDNESLVNR